MPSLYYKYWYIKNKESALDKCKQYYDEKGKEQKRKQYALKTEFKRLAAIEI